MNNGNESNSQYAERMKILYKNDLLIQELCERSISAERQRVGLLEALKQDAAIRSHDCPGCPGDECGASSASEELWTVTIPALVAGDETIINELFQKVLAVCGNPATDDGLVQGDLGPELTTKGEREAYQIGRRDADAEAEQSNFTDEIREEVLEELENEGFTAAERHLKELWGYQ